MESNTLHLVYSALYEVPLLERIRNPLWYPELMRQLEAMRRLTALLLWPVVNRILSFLTVGSVSPESDKLFMMVRRMISEREANRICGFVDDRSDVKRVVRCALLRNYWYAYVGWARDLQGDRRCWRRTVQELYDYVAYVGKRSTDNLIRRRASSLENLIYEQLCNPHTVSMWDGVRQGFPIVIDVVDG